jgi:G3E family GTPase
MQQIPVYLFTGFLEAGKTKFIQETLEDERFNAGERTLLLMCEDGMEEYDPESFSSPNVFITEIENTKQLNPDKLTRLLKANRCVRVVIEYNGMWMLDDLYQALPDNWAVAQEFMFADANTFLNYNANMRGLVVDKLKSCELAVFNRADGNIDKMAIHKIVRAISRRTDIAYESSDGRVEYDEIVDPLPFDLNAPVVEIKDQDYAIWYSNLSENLENYDGKTVQVKGFAFRDKKLPDSAFIFGRRLMTCCVEDIQFAGVVCEYPKAPAVVQDRKWYTVTAKVIVKKHKAYGKVGPVLEAVSVVPAEPPAEEVATFY